MTSLQSALTLKPEEISSRYKVLLVEDSPASVSLVTAYLAGSEVDLAVSGDGMQGFEAFKRAANEGTGYDFVLMDIDMPVLDGCAAIRAIRTWERLHESEPTPIAALTGMRSKDDVDKILGSGCSNYLTKPISRIDLLQCLSRFQRATRKYFASSIDVRAVVQEPRLEGSLG